MVVIWFCLGPIKDKQEEDFLILRNELAVHAVNISRRLRIFYRMIMIFSNELAINISRSLRTVYMMIMTALEALLVVMQSEGS